MYRVLCNYGLFTEGYDLPSIGAVILMRPTMSRALYCQMVGRGLRPSDTGEDLIVVDFPWVSGNHRLVKPAELFYSAHSRYTEEAIRNAERMLDIGATDDILAAIKTADEEIKIRDRFKLEVRERTVKSTVREYNPLSDKERAALPRRRESEEPRLRPATPAQIACLNANGVAGASGMSFVRAHLIITAIKEKERRGEAPYWMIDKLVRMGVDRKVARVMKIDVARRLLGQLAEGPAPGELF
jgi:hypothetical protein